ncbi:MAG: hypothetical protein ACMG57_02395 [Candidatus Dojkabacteria bacterium]
MHLVRKFLFNFIKYFALAFCIFWAFIHIFVQIVGYDRAVIIVGQVLNVPTNDLIAGSTVNENEVITNIQVQFYSIFFVASFISAIFGTIVLSQGRSFAEVIFLFVGYAIPRQRKFWGVIYDTETGKPIALATIRLQTIDEDGNKEFISQTVSDLDGRYRLNIGKMGQKYLVEVSANEYKGNQIEISSSNTETLSKEIARDIALSKEQEAKKSNLKDSLEKFRSRIYLPTIVYMYIFNFFGIFFALYGIIANPSPTDFINLTIFTISAIWNTIVVRERFKVNVGRLLDMKSRKPIDLVMVKIFDDEDKSIVAYTDNAGGVKFDLPEGTYKALIAKDNYKLIKEGVDTLVPVKVKSTGYLQNNLYLEKDEKSTNENENNSGFINPFG